MASRRGLAEHGRGGLFGMPVILAKNSVGRRTSPVKRGFWVVHHLLGQHFPPPPADVPELPPVEKESDQDDSRDARAAHDEPEVRHVPRPFRRAGPDDGGLRRRSAGPARRTSPGAPIDDVGRLPGRQNRRRAFPA